MTFNLCGEGSPNVEQQRWWKLSHINRFPYYLMISPRNLYSFLPLCYPYLIPLISILPSSYELSHIFLWSSYILPILSLYHPHLIPWSQHSPCILCLCPPETWTFSRRHRVGARVGAGFRHLPPGLLGAAQGPGLPQLGFRGSWMVSGLEMGLKIN